MRWRPYIGWRIKRPGYRMFVEDPPTLRFGPFTKRYGCVWPEGDGYGAYYEEPRPREIEDVELGPFRTAREARRAVEGSLGRGHASAFPRG